MGLWNDGTMVRAYGVHEGTEWATWALPGKLFRGAVFIGREHCAFQNQDVVDDFEIRESSGGMLLDELEIEDGEIIGQWLVFVDPMPIRKLMNEIRLAISAIEVAQIRFDEQVAIVAKEKMQSNRDDALTDDRIAKRRGIE